MIVIDCHLPCERKTEGKQVQWKKINLFLHVKFEMPFRHPSVEAKYMVDESKYRENVDLKYTFLSLEYITYMMPIIYDT